MLTINAKYLNGTNRFWVFVYEDPQGDGIFKFYIPHSHRREDDKWMAMPKPTSMDIHVEFDEIPEKVKR